MDSRPIPGDGLEHERDYIEERLEDAGDTDEYAAADQKLKQEERDLSVLEGKQAPARSQGSSGAVQATSAVDGDRMRQRQGSELKATAGSQIDLDQQPPEAEAREGTVDRMREGLDA